MISLPLLGAGAAVATVVLAAATRTRALQRLDDAVETYVGTHREFLEPLARIGTLPGEPYMHWTIGAVTAAVLLLLRPESRWSIVVPLALASLGAILAHHAVKAVYRRPRPAIALGKGKTEPAFPSGHTADATAVLLTSAALLVRAGVLPVPMAFGVAIALSLGTGASRVALGWHWATDVVGGWMVGVGVACYCVG